VKLIWTRVEQHGGINKISIDFAYISHVRVNEFIEGEKGDLWTPWNGTYTKT
jgi:hypothetical protein